MGFRAFLVMDNKVARQVMAENGRKWSKMVENGFPRVSRHGHQGGQAGNGRKWLKMAENGGKKVHRGYLVGNGFSRVSRHSPTTFNLHVYQTHCFLVTLSSFHESNHYK